MLQVYISNQLPTVTMWVTSSLFVVLFPRCSPSFPIPVCFIFTQSTTIVSQPSVCVVAVHWSGREDMTSSPCLLHGSNSRISAWWSSSFVPSWFCTSSPVKLMFWDTWFGNVLIPFRRRIWSLQWLSIILYWNCTCTKFCTENMMS